MRPAGQAGAYGTRLLRHAYDELPYGEALCRWEDDDSNPRDFFTTEDPYLLYFRKKIMDRFRLRILTPEEAVIERKHGPFQTFKVTGFPSFSDKLN